MDESSWQNLNLNMNEGGNQILSAFWSEVRGSAQHNLEEQNKTVIKPLDLNLKS